MNQQRRVEKELEQLEKQKQKHKTEKEKQKIAKEQQKLQETAMGKSRSHKNETGQLMIPSTPQNDC